MKRLTKCEKRILRKISSEGGKARAASLSPARRKEIAKAAVAAREAKKKRA